MSGKIQTLEELQDFDNYRRFMKDRVKRIDGTGSPVFVPKDPIEFTVGGKVWKGRPVLFGDPQSLVVVKALKKAGYMCREGTVRLEDDVLVIEGIESKMVKSADKALQKLKIGSRARAAGEELDAPDDGDGAQSSGAPGAGRFEKEASAGGVAHSPNTASPNDAAERAKLSGRMSKLLPDVKLALGQGGATATEVRALTLEFGARIKEHSGNGLTAAENAVHGLEKLLAATNRATPEQKAERRRLEDGLKLLVPKVKNLADGRDARAGEAIELAKETGGLLSGDSLEAAKRALDALKALLGGKAGVPDDPSRRAPQSDGEVSAEEFMKDLGGAISNVSTLKTAAEALGLKDLGEHVGKVGSALSAVKVKVGALVSATTLARDIQEFQRALKAARGLDLNRDYKAAATAMSDLVVIGGKLAKQAAGNGVPGLDGYFTLLQNAGAVWEAGARLRKRKEREWDEASKSDGKQTDDPRTPVRRAKKASSAEIALDDVVAFMQQNMKTLEEETKWTGGTFVSAMVDGGLANDRFLKAFATFKELHDQRKVIALRTLSPTYRELSKRMQAPHAEALKELEHLQEKLGSRPELSVTYEPALKAMRTAQP